LPETDNKANSYPRKPNAEKNGGSKEALNSRFFPKKGKKF